ncbi:MAG: hypothetical protein RIT14_510 [Pseudomonadota bacterium]|jgi:membrane associated rhomboid family serine protease
MLPIRDHNPSGRKPLVTTTLIVINVVVFLSYFPGMESDRAAAAFFGTWGLVPARIGLGQGYETFVTSMFLHGGWMHLIGNMLFLWIFGDNLEDAMGHARFLAFYVAAGLAAALGQMAADPGSLVPMVGASGAIAGVMGGYLLLFPRARVDVLMIFVVFVRVFAVPAWLMLGLWFALQLASGALMPADLGGVAYWAHAGGFVAGLALAVPVWLRRGGTAFWGQTEGAPPHPAARYPLRRSAIPQVPRKDRRGPWG